MELTRAQVDVASAPPSCRQVVFGPAGSGKTAVLVARVAALVDDFSLSPGSEILGLTFTRAATHEISLRLKEIGGRAAFVVPSTFDSMATRLLVQFGPAGVLDGEGYDGRVRAAARLLEELVEARSWLLGVRHVLVDEIQDLVGDRASFVLTLLRALGGGFTLFGDPAQAIYGFQLLGAVSALTSRQFYQGVTSELSPAPLSVHLQARFRARTKEAGIAELAGNVLGGEGPIDFGAARRGLETSLLAAPQLSIRSSLPALREYGSSAVLCRYNSQALVISGQLFDYGVPHRLQQSADDVAAPSWLGACFSALEYSRVGRTMFRGIVEAEPTAPEPGLGVEDLEAHGGQAGE